MLCACTGSTAGSQKGWQQTHLLVVVDQVLAGSELVGVHDIHQLAILGPLRLQVLSIKLLQGRASMSSRHEVGTLLGAELEAFDADPCTKKLRT